MADFALPELSYHTFMDKILLRILVVLFALATAVLLLAQTSQPPAGQQPPPSGTPNNTGPKPVATTRWEYRTEAVELITGTNERSRNDPEGLRLRTVAAAAGQAREADLRNNVMKSLGEQGWELVAVYSFEDASAEEIGVRTNVRFVFKRKAGEVAVSSEKKN